MAKPDQILFLEDWLRTKCSNTVDTGNIGTKQAPPSSAQAIIQAWANLRDCIQRRSFQTCHLQSLKTLADYRGSIYVADPQANLILTILSSSDLSLPWESYPLLLRLLYVWVRKSSKPSIELVDAAVNVTSQLLIIRVENTIDAALSAEGILLLGAFSNVASVSDGNKAVCLESLLNLLDRKNHLNDSSNGFIPEIYAGIGYGLLSAGSLHFLRLLHSLFSSTKEEGKFGIPQGLVILHLIEWVVSGFINAYSMARIETFISEIMENSNATQSSSAIVMASAGILRVLNGPIRSNKMDIIFRLKNSALARLEAVATELVSQFGGSSRIITDRRVSFLMQCISLAICRCGQLDLASGSLLVCLALSMLTEVFPLKKYYTKVLHQPLTDAKEVEDIVVKRHLDSLLFKEAGAIAGSFCNLYSFAREEDKLTVEDFVWEFCQYVYQEHRLVALLVRGKLNGLLGHIEKVAESAFLMVVVFALAVVRHKLNNNFPREIQMDVSLKILISFSCMEYFRRIRLSEYVETIRCVVVSVQMYEPACISFAESMPSYAELIHPQEASYLHPANYTWTEDEVQTARVLFYLRVIPTAVEHMPSPVFRNSIVAKMFLYMGHPNVKVARAAHSVFVSFISSGKDSDEDERISLKEQLIFHYMKRSLEGYPGFTPFDGLASGVAALVRHLPAGSPSIYFCVHSLVEKASDLCREAMSKENESWTNWQGFPEPCGKVLGLLSRLVTMVDLQVLPELMKLWAQLVIQLPKDRQNLVLNDLYDLVADSDDVTRKTSLVSWLQSLSYICSKESVISNGLKTSGIGGKNPRVHHTSARL